MPALRLRCRHHPQRMALPLIGRLEVLCDFPQEVGQIDRGPIEFEGIGIPIMVPDVGRGLLPRLDKYVLLTKKLKIRFEDIGRHAFFSNYFQAVTA